MLSITALTDSFHRRILRRWKSYSITTLLDTAAPPSIYPSPSTAASVRDLSLTFVRHHQSHRSCSDHRYKSFQEFHKSPGPWQIIFYCSSVSCPVPFHIYIYLGREIFFCFLSFSTLSRLRGFILYSALTSYHDRVLHCFLYPRKNWVSGPLHLKPEVGRSSLLTSGRLGAQRLPYYIPLATEINGTTAHRSMTIEKEKESMLSSAAMPRITLVLRAEKFYHLATNTT